MTIRTCVAACVAESLLSVGASPGKEKESLNGTYQQLRLFALLLEELLLMLPFYAQLSPSLQ